MLELGIHIYIIPTSDFHGSEYISDYFKGREYLSGFTGSAGTLVITRSTAALFTDGRYYIQAEKEVLNTEIQLYKEGMKSVPTLIDYILSNLPEKGKLGFDGRMISAQIGFEYEKVTKMKAAKIVYDQDILQQIWMERPEIHFSSPFILEEKYAGDSVEEKLIWLRMEMQKNRTEAYVCSSLDEVAWLYNLRGRDIPNNPVFYSYTVITQEEAHIFLKKKVLHQEVEMYLTNHNIQIKEYDEIQEFLNKKTRKNQGVLVDFNKINYSLYKCIGNGVNLVNVPGTIAKKKAVKNPVEIENIKKAHIKDGVCMAKFIYWLKNNVGKEKITQTSAADYVKKLRKQMPGFIEESFETISAYNENAAMMHYSCYEDKEVLLQNQGVLLVDSGGHYLEGSTDVTRTIILGEITKEVRTHYTMVLKSMLRLANATFLYGCTGQNLDILAREPIWSLGLDYKCGTGHGIGYALNVHEGPNGFRWQSSPGRDSVPFEPGMVTTDEPGIYIEGSYGIRIENELLCVVKEENEFGRFLEFETITYVPIDTDGVDYTLLNSKEKEMLIKYNQMVIGKISPFLEEEEKKFFEES